MLKPLTSSSPPLPHAAPAPLAPSPTQLSTSSPINCRGDVMAWVAPARWKFLFISEGESCIQTGSEMLDHHSNTTYVYHSPLSDHYHRGHHFGIISPKIHFLVSSLSCPFSVIFEPYCQGIRPVSYESLHQSNRTFCRRTRCAKCTSRVWFKLSRSIIFLSKGLQKWALLYLPALSSRSVHLL